MAEQSSRRILIAIVVIGFLVRVVGITYGLPLWLVGDEPPFVLSALKMIELKTLIPALHETDFAAISYFPPYLSYLYLPLFIPLLAIQFLFFAGTASEFVWYLLTDLSTFFVAARIASVLLGTLTIWLLYRVAQNIFQNKLAALFSAAFLSLSALHVLLSHWGRDWVPAAFFFVLALYTLTHPLWSEKKRYLTTALIAGIAFGISAAGVFIPVFMALWIYFVEQKRILEIIRDRKIWLAALVFLVLAGISVALFPAGFFFTETNSFAVPKTLQRLTDTYGSFLRPFFFTDPILTLWALVGFVWMFFWERKKFLTFFLFINIYIFAFFVSFHTGDRFALYLYPLLTLTAGYGLWKSWEYANKKRIVATLGAISFVLMLIIDIKMDQIILKNDTRMQARAWIEKNIQTDKKILVLSPLTRLSATPAAIAEQEIIAPQSLRKVDQAERILSKDFLRYPPYHALNLYTVGREKIDFYQQIDSYRIKNGYRYALVSTEGFGKSDQGKQFALNLLRAKGKIIASFQGSGLFEQDLTEGSINVWQLWNNSSNGPIVYILDLSPSPGLEVY